MLTLRNGSLIRSSSLSPKKRSAAAAENPFASWDSVPLFMKSLPSELGGQTSTEQADQTSVDTLAALQALAYDGTPAGEEG